MCLLSVKITTPWTGLQTPEKTGITISSDLHLQSDSTLKNMEQGWILVGTPKLNRQLVSCDLTMINFTFQISFLLALYVLLNNHFTLLFWSEMWNAKLLFFKDSLEVDITKMTKKKAAGWGGRGRKDIGPSHTWHMAQTTALRTIHTHKIQFRSLRNALSRMCFIITTAWLKLTQFLKP